MNMNKLKDFTKKYGFYLGVAVVSIGAITAVVLTTSRDSDLTDADMPAQMQEVLGEDVVIIPNNNLEEAPILSGELVEENYHSTAEEVVDFIEVEETENIVEQVTPEVEEVVIVDDEEEAIVSETFSSTTADPNELPFFAEGDTLLWPVAGEVIVPYRDDTTKHWFSTALQQTMRTYGVCISAKEGEGIKSPAKGTIVDIVSDSSTLPTTKYVGNIGEVIIMDFGNGYRAEIGIQGGKADKELIGQVVEAAQVIGTVGNGTGPFADMSYNVYMQIRHNDEIVDPTTMLSYHESVAGVDMGHVAE